jgi:hypothetical protein
MTAPPMQSRAVRTQNDALRQALDVEIAAVSLFLRDLPATPQTGRCRRALAQARDIRLPVPSRMGALRVVRADLRSLGYTGALPP